LPFNRLSLRGFAPPTENTAFVQAGSSRSCPCRRDVEFQEECDEDHQDRIGRMERWYQDGKGSISTESGALQAYPYGFSSRFEGRPDPV